MKRSNRQALCFVLLSAVVLSSCIQRSASTQPPDPNASPVWTTDERASVTALRRTEDAQTRTAMPRTATPVPPSTPTPEPISYGKTWVCPEGYTVFDNWFTLLNLNGETATVEAHYYVVDAGLVTRTHFIPPESRYSIPAHSEGELGRGEGGKGVSYSVVFSSDVPLASVEESIYRDTGGGNDACSPYHSTSWAFAEGFTGGGTDTFVLAFNPNNVPATVTFRFIPVGEAPSTAQPAGSSQTGESFVEVTETIPPFGRFTVAAQDPRYMGEDQAFGIQVSSDKPIVVGRSMYFPTGMTFSLGVADPIGIEDPE